MSLKIRLTRSENKDQDDTILIRRRQASGFLVRFVDGNAPKTVWVSEKTSFVSDMSPVDDPHAPKYLHDTDGHRFSHVH